MAVIRMLKTFGSNVSGEVCGQPDDVAASMVERGLAIFVTAAPVQAVTKEMKPSDDVVFAEAKEEEGEVKGLFKKSKKKG